MTTKTCPHRIMLGIGGLVRGRGRAPPPPFSTPFLLLTSPTPSLPRWAHPSARWWPSMSRVAVPPPFTLTRLHPPRPPSPSCTSAHPLPSKMPSRSQITGGTRGGYDSDDITKVGVGWEGGGADAHTAHHATFSTAPAHQLLGSANAETTPARAPAAAADRKQRPDATCEGKNG